MGFSVLAALFAVVAAVAVFLSTRRRWGTGRAALAALATFTVLAVVILVLIGEATRNM